VLQIFTSYAYVPDRHVAIVDLEKEIRTAEDLTIEGRFFCGVWVLWVGVCCCLVVLLVCVLLGCVWWGFWCLVWCVWVGG